MPPLMPTPSESICTVKLCKGIIFRIERWRSTKWSEVAAAECSSCAAGYWLFRRDNYPETIRIRSPFEVDQRKKERDEERINRLQS